MLTELQKTKKQNVAGERFDAVYKKRLNILLTEVRRAIKRSISRECLDAIYSKKLNILYVPTPKVACSSIKTLLYRLENDADFDAAFFRKRGIYNVHDLYSKNYLFIDRKQIRNNSARLKFAVIRDPIKRAISCYANRVVFHRDVERSPASVRRLAKSGLPAVPDIDTFFLNLEQYRQANRSIRHHIGLQRRYVGSKLDVYDKVYKLENLRDLEGDLSDVVGRRVELPISQTGGPKLQASSLSQAALARLIDFCQPDYALLKGYYDRDDVMASR